MRKLFALLIAAAMVLSLTACAAPAADEPAPATEETAAPEETVPEAEPWS